MLSSFRRGRQGGERTRPAGRRQRTRWGAVLDGTSSSRPCCLFDPGGSGSRTKVLLHVGNFSVHGKWVDSVFPFLSVCSAILPRVNRLSDHPSFNYYISMTATHFLLLLHCDADTTLAQDTIFFFSFFSHLSGLVCASRGKDKSKAAAGRREYPRTAAKNGARPARSDKELRLVLRQKKKKRRSDEILLNSKRSFTEKTVQDKKKKKRKRRASLGQACVSWAGVLRIFRPVQGRNQTTIFNNPPMISVYMVLYASPSSEEEAS